MGVTASVTGDEPHLLPEPLGPPSPTSPRYGSSAVSPPLFGVAPRLVGRVWVVVGYRAVRQHARRPPRLAQWAFELSPFGVVPLLPVEQLTIAPLAALTAAAAAAITIGVVGFRHRDLQSPT